jgi:2-C-methyl-D-erythritol 4-phosphate cytidylyltransferase
VGRVWGIVVAGGSGSRFGEAKQFVSLAGRPVVEHSVAACRSVCDAVVLVVPAGSSTTTMHGADIVVEGGATRAASVRAGLDALGPDAEIVVVHDAARPLARPSLFKAVVAALHPGAVAGSIPGVPVSDTVKRVAPSSNAEDGIDVVETLARADLVAVQTPQAFYVDALRRAHDGEPDATDDAALIEALGLRVSVVPGDADNLKLTTPADLARAELLIGD